MKCKHCDTNMRASDIDDTIFKRVKGVGVVGNIKCRKCAKETMVKQAVIFIPVDTPARREGD